MKNWNHVERKPEDIRNPKITSDIYLQFSAISDDVKANAKEAKGILLDIGAGMAPYELFFRPYIKKYIKMDGFYYKNGKSDLIGDGMNIPMKDNSVDTVLCTQVLEHVQNPQKVIDEIKRVLKPNGVCILTTHMANPLHGLPHDYFRFTKYAFTNILFKNFKSIRVKENGGALLSISQFICWGISEKLPKIIALPIIVFINLTIKPLDKIMFNEMFTTNYIVIAKK